MGMSETMSNPSTDWLQFYQHPHHRHQQQQQLSGHTQMADATAVTTTITTASTGPAGGSNNNNNNFVTAHLNPEGRVSKPIRRRSRASRRTPTTLLNTDTSNFRAMVQQFTGAPSAPFASGSPHPVVSGTTFNFGLQPVSGGPAVMIPTGYHIQFQQQQQQQQQLMLSLNNNDNSNNNRGVDAFLGNSRGNSMEVISDHHGFGSISSPQVQHPRNTASSSNENRNYGNYMF